MNTLGVIPKMCKSVEWLVIFESNNIFDGKKDGHWFYSGGWRIVKYKGCSKEEIKELTGAREVIM